MISGLVMGGSLSTVFVYAANKDASKYKELDVQVDDTDFKDINEVDGAVLSDLKIGVVTDVHISAKNDGKQSLHLGDATKRFKETLKYYKRNGVDTIMLTGDFVNYGVAEDYALFVNCLEEVFGTPENAPDLIPVYGNHEGYVYKDTENKTGVGVTTSAAQYALMKEYVQPWTSMTIYNGKEGAEAVGSPVSYVVKDDVYILSLPTGWNDASFARLDSVLAEASNASDKPIVVGLHYSLNPDLYAGLDGATSTYISEENYNKLVSILAKYPKAVVFSGHEHATALHERAISQDLGYTNVVAAVSNIMGFQSHPTGTPAGVRYDNYISSHESILEEDGLGVWGRYNFCSLGQVLTFDEDSMNIQIVNLKENRTYTDLGWEIPYGITLENKAEKFAYVNSVRKTQQAELTFKQGAKVELSLRFGKLCVAFPSVQEYRKVEGYKIVIQKEGQDDIVLYWHSNFIKYPESIVTYQVQVNSETSTDGYTVSVYPIDMYGNVSSPITNA